MFKLVDEILLAKTSVQILELHLRMCVIIPWFQQHDYDNLAWFNGHAFKEIYHIGRYSN